MDVSTILHGFVKIDTRISLKWYMDFTLDTFIKIFNYVYINKTFAL